MQWTLDPAHSQIQFSVKHMGISTVRGTFQQFTGSIKEENGDVRSVDVAVDTGSLNTGASQRDDHLRSGDFFNSSEHPSATFHLTKFDKQGDEVLAIGALTIRDISKPVTLRGEINGPAIDPWGNRKVSATLETKISRKEWGLVWNAALEAGGVLVSDEVKLLIDLQAVPVEATVAV